MPHRLRVAPWSAALLALLVHASARADEQDTLNVMAKQSVQRDSNLFLRPNAAPGTSRSEVLSTSLLGMELDKRYSLQRIELDASLSAYRYRYNDNLDFNALNYRAAWHWSLTPRLTGLLSDTREEVLNTFDYFRSFERNVRTERNTHATAELMVGHDWRLLGDVERVRRTNELPTAQGGDFTVDRQAIGLRHVWPSGSSLSYRMRQGSGDYFNRVPGVSALPTAFDERSHELRASWQASGKTTVNARIAHLAREHPGLAVRDYAGMVGDISVQWRATAKLGVQLSLARELTAYQTNTSSYASSNRVSVNPYWAIGPRTLLYMGFDHRQQQFGGALPGSVDENRQDTTRGTLASLQWKPIDAMSLSASLYLSRRSSNLEGFGFSNNMASVSAQFQF